MMTMATSEPTLPVIWRTKLRSTVHQHHRAQVQHCLDSKLIGVGWRLDGLPDEPSLDLVCARVERHPGPGWGRRAAQTVHRFGQEAQPGDFVWTRDTSGRYLLCRITGEYRYDRSAQARAVDVHQVRDVDWAPKELNDLQVPGAVIRSFIGTGYSFSRIHDPGARQFTGYLWELLNGRPARVPAFTREEVLKCHLDPYDLEDLIYVWMQAELNYIALPRARQRDTPAYEWSMLHRDSRHRGIVQIKTGKTPVDLEALRAAVTDETTDVFAYSTSDRYDGDWAQVHRIQDGELLQFEISNRHLLPDRVRHWFELAVDSDGAGDTNALPGRY